MLEVQSLSFAYGGHEALRDVTIRVRAGEAVAILGANGAGKTTLLNAIAGLLPIKSGSILFEGRELAGMDPHCIIELGVAIVSENRHLFGPMSVIENLMLGAYPRRAHAGAAATLHRVYDLFPRLAERRRQTVRTMSGGEQQMVAIGRALMSRPKLLLLDEPSLGLSPVLASQLFAVLSRIARDGPASILIAEQNAGRALGLATRAYLLSLGHVVGEEDARRLANDGQIVRSYLAL
jgi:ABC-type branched-subunit amino acid transport system ATPase component